MNSTIWTIGHSTRPLDAFLELLAGYRLEAVADVRRFPRSAAGVGRCQIRRTSAGGMRRFEATTLMCAEAMWWRCHRALIADALCVRGLEVVHILDAKHTVTHPYTAPARIVQGRLSYLISDK